MAAISTFFRLLLLISFVPSVFPQDTVFDVELVHRDSPKSPLYNSSMTPFDQLQAAVVRSVNRASYFDKRIDMNTSIDIELDLKYSGGEFLMRFGLGTPNLQYVFGFIDTGNYLNWVDCAGCQCFNLSGAQFYPYESLSYNKLPCNSDECNSLRLGRCNKDKMCQYHVTFGDGSNIDGIFSSETLSFTSLDTNQTTSFPNILFGCNFRSLHTKMEDPGSSIGLSPNSPSLINQLAPKYISKYFSYCLDVLNGASRLFLGRGKQTITGTTMVTPLMTQDNFYAVQLNAISIPQEFAVFLPKRSVLRAGNIIFDSGSAMTILDTEVMGRLVTELTYYVSLPTVKAGSMKLCFNVLSTEDEEDLPGLWFSFAGTSGNFRVRPENVFRWYNPHVKCMVIVETSGLQVFGNIMQQDVLVGHDLDKMELTIIEKQCTEL
ncbi:probable aspartic protease At2g35615 [Zingiber officinale]|uniref:probable aspartic protease At2g35615 n=1 Tax=Zingiber officinale TaxID=94328 RepID=UPI001C4C1EFC|nr:probable aspartic protease At2g35615 [Zingiber officinale]